MELRVAYRDKVYFLLINGFGIEGTKPWFHNPVKMICFDEEEGREREFIYPNHFFAFAVIQKGYSSKK